jgi:glucosyl-3-phosphoglycerate synthase
MGKYRGSCAPPPRVRKDDDVSLGIPVVPDGVLASYHADEFGLSELLDAKLANATTVSVVLPARNEETTVGGIVASIRENLMDDVPLVDEVVVMDSFSTDGTAARAAEAGARVVACSKVVPQIPAWPGKGEALWRSIFVTTGELVVFIDADIEDAGPHFVTGLLGPLLTAGRDFSKGFYQRPLLNLYWPPLAQFVQPLAGEYGIRRSVLTELRFPTGYGVEIAMLIDLLHWIGIERMAQVDLGRRTHSHQATPALGAMAAEIMGTALRRLELEPGNRTLRQFRHVEGDLVDRLTGIPLLERPPASWVQQRAQATPPSQALDALGEGL